MQTEEVAVAVAAEVTEAEVEAVVEAVVVMTGGVVGVVDMMLAVIAMHQSKPIL